MAEAFAELLAGENLVRAEMAARVRARASPDDSLHKLGLAGGGRARVTAYTATALPEAGRPKPAAQADRSIDSLVSSTASKPAARREAAPEASRTLLAHSAPAAASPDPTPRGGLQSVLALRKAQVGQAKISGQLSGLRSGKDSDDDDDEEDEEDASHRVGVAASADSSASGGTGDAATFDRALNLLGDESAAARHAALKQLRGFKLSGVQRKALLRPLLLRFADQSERVRELAATLFEEWVEGAETPDVTGCLPFFVPVLVERIGARALRKRTA